MRNGWCPGLNPATGHKEAKASFIKNLGVPFGGEAGGLLASRHSRTDGYAPCSRVTKCAHRYILVCDGERDVDRRLIVIGFAPNPACAGTMVSRYSLALIKVKLVQPPLERETWQVAFLSFISPPTTSSWCFSFCVPCSGLSSRCSRGSIISIMKKACIRYAWGDAALIVRLKQQVDLYGPVPHPFLIRVFDRPRQSIGDFALYAFDDIRNENVAPGPSRLLVTARHPGCLVKARHHIAPQLRKSLKFVRQLNGILASSILSVTTTQQVGQIVLRI